MSTGRTEDSAAAESDNLDETVAHLAEMHRRHDLATGPIQRAANHATGALATPIALTLILFLIVAWIAGNAAAERFGIRSFERFPFPDLAFVATLTALVVALLILTTQRHQDRLAERRAQLTLQIAMLSERKIAKIIALLEEQRRENPMLPSREDPEAAEMARAINPEESMDRIERDG